MSEGTLLDEFETHDIKGVSYAELLSAVTLRDEGVGVEPRHLERILKPFPKLDRDGAGHGMGLAVCQKIMQGHHGHLEVSSDGLDQGFKVKLVFRGEARSSYLKLT